MTAGLLALPILAALVLLLRPNRAAARLALPGAAALTLAVVGIVWSGGAPPGKISRFFMIDAAGLWLLTILAVVFAATAVYSLFYFKTHGDTPRRESYYAAVMLLFLSSMAGVLLSRHLALLWVFMEATTLTSALLIYYEQKKASLEAAWKYVFICSVGIALAFVGIILLSMGSTSIGTLYFDDLTRYAAQINPFWLKMAFAFILVGFGTKMGLAPIHAWLPDAHSEAPSPVSALLSGALLNTAFLGLFRIHQIMIAAGQGKFSSTLLLGVGFLSLLISAVFMRGIVNYKRMLAYSSIENMGLLAIGIALGPLGTAAAFLHCAAHSLAKTSLFLTSGNILHLYNSKRVKDVRGLLRRHAPTGWIWILSLLAILGMPPFPSFLSKILLVIAFFQAGAGWLSIPFFLLMAVILAGMGSAGFGMAFGDFSPPAAPGGRLPRTAVWSQTGLLLLLLAIGISIPGAVMTLLHQAAGILP